MLVYLDHNASTPTDPRVFEAMLPYLREHFGNPNSAHSHGAVARRAIDWAREQVGELVGASPTWVNFTASATEAVSMAVWSTFAARKQHQTRIVATAVEHSAVLESARALARFGIDVSIVPVTRSGSLDMDVLSGMVTDSVLLVSVMWANNETGVVFPVSDVAELCAERGVPLLVDAVQAAGRIDIDLEAFPVTYVALSSHKIFGPKGGAALIAPPKLVVPLVRGGGQERGHRSGTENVAAIVGFGEASRLARVERVKRNEKSARLRDAFERALCDAAGDCEINGIDTLRLPNTSSVTIHGVDGDALVAMLDARGISVSTGSACHSRSVAPSHVIAAMTGSHRHATETVRISFSHLNTSSELRFLVATLTETVASLRAATKRSS